jgi:hypothetical protein
MFFLFGFECIRWYLLHVERTLYILSVDFFGPIIIIVLLPSASEPEAQTCGTWPTHRTASLVVARDIKPISIWSALVSKDCTYYLAIFNE